MLGNAPATSATRAALARRGVRGVRDTQVRRWLKQLLLRGQYAEEPAPEGAAPTNNKSES
jgi:hypothetical protein